jgi:hypothetical protein
MNQNFIANAVSRVMAQAVSTGLFVSLATFQRPSGTFDAGGAPDGLYANVPGLTSIPCMKASPGDSVRASEARTEQNVTDLGPWHILLNGLYPEVESGWRGEDANSTGPWRVVVDGVDYDIRGVERDSQSKMTRLEAFLVTI